jgi:hypothetical protein
VLLLRADTEQDASTRVGAAGPSGFVQEAVPARCTLRDALRPAIDARG